MTLHQEQEQNDIQLADWIINRALGPQDPFDQNAMINWTESGRERIRALILGAFKSARRNTATVSCVPNIDTQRMDWLATEWMTSFSFNPNMLWRVVAHGEQFFGETLRDAIDAAMASNNPPAEE